MKNIFQTPKPTPKRLVSLAMLIALAFIVGKFSIPIIPQQLVVSLTFIVNTIIGMIAGPLGFISLAILDVVDNLSSGEGTSSFGGHGSIQGFSMDFLLQRITLVTKDASCHRNTCNHAN